MSPGRLEILTEALTFVARLIMEARSDRDAEDMRDQLRALGPSQRSNVDRIERERRLELVGFEPVDVDALGTLPRKRLAPDFPPKGGE